MKNENINAMKKEKLELMTASLLSRTHGMTSQEQIGNEIIEFSDKVVKLLAAAPSKKAKCYNCKHASYGFKIAGKTHHQCNHPKHEEGFKSGELSPWDTLQEFYNTCNSHEFR